MTRPFHCPNHHAHVEAKYYVIFGTTRQKVFPQAIYFRIIKDITPHIISFEDVGGDTIPIAVSCAIHGCGITMNNIHDITEGIVIHQVRNFTLTRADFEALKNFKRSGYELSKTKRHG